MPSDDLIQRLFDLYHFGPLPIEGGYFIQTYQSGESIPLAGLPSRYDGPHPLGTAILYLFTPESDCFSALHRLPTDEIYHFYLGDPVEMLLLYPEGSARRVLLGQDIFNGQQVQFCVPAGVWQGSHLRPGGKYALIGTSMAPGYIDEDYNPGDRASLTRSYPSESDLIRSLTRPLS